MKRKMQFVAILLTLSATITFAQMDGRTAYWNGVLASHSNSVWQTRSGTTPLALLVTTFSGADRVSTHRWLVGTNGMCRLWRESLIAIQGDFRRQLSERDMTALVQTLTTLPPSVDLTSTNRVVMISYRRGAEWETRRYDADNPPDQVAVLLSQIEQMTKPERDPEPPARPYGSPAAGSPSGQP